ncbi:MAG: hydantoinase/oxoprolinase family protein [Dehalococcoidales bacterium]
MEFSIDIDTGGTFTDGFVRGDGRIELAKVETTPHDRTLCFIECIEEAARKFGFESASQLLTQTNTLRLSTTIGTNALIQASGPKLGLLVTRGVGENAYAQKGTNNPAIDFLIPGDMIIGIDEEVSGTGESVRLPGGTEVLAAVKTLLEKGARRIVVSLAKAPLNPASEKKCREIILDDYPAHYLGSVPLLLSTEVSSEVDDLYRTNSALIDAYIHREMAHYLYKADDDVRDRRYKWPLLIGHATGGVARVAKTKAIDTCDSGPAAGLFGAAYIARMYGLENVVTVDVGGTSTDIGLVINGEPCYTANRTMGGVPVKEWVIETISIGGGGSSVAWLDTETKQIRVGPDSAGAIPGPASYGLGGSDTTVTDAWVTLGYIDPDYFLGGRRKLDVALARDIIKEQIADPLNITVEQAAEAIIKEMSSQSAQSVREFVSEKGLEAENVSMFAFGGAGGLACPGIAQEAGIGRIYLFPFGAQFCAFGSSCTDVRHNYSAATNLTLTPDSDDTTLREFNRVTREMMVDAVFDMEGEGFKKDKVSFNLEVVMSSGDSTTPAIVRWTPITLKDGAAVKALLAQYRTEAGSDDKNAPVSVNELRLQASCQLTHPQFPEHSAVGEDSQKALKGTRAARWNGKLEDARVYDLDKLECGNVVKGLAFVESADTTILVPPGISYRIDSRLNGVMEEE